MDSETVIGRPLEPLSSENLGLILDALNGKGLAGSEAEYELARAIAAVLRERHHAG